MFYADQLTGSMIQAFPGKHIELRAAPKTQSDFLEMALVELKRARSTQRAFLSYQTALEDQEAFSRKFYTSEREVTWTAVTQLEDARDELTELIDQASSLPFPTSTVPEQMQIDLDYARSACAHHRNLIYHNHVFYKINWSMVLSKTGSLPSKNFWVPAVQVYLNNKWGAQCWDHPVTRISLATQNVDHTD